MKKTAIKIAFVLAVTVLAWFNLPVAIVSICAVILVTLYDKFHHLIEFSFGPLKAKLERDISTAEDLVEKLRIFAIFQARSAITSTVRMNRWPGQDDIWQFENAKKFEQSLKEIRVAEEELKEVRADLVWFAIFDAGLSATGGGTLPTHLPQEAQREWSAARKSGEFKDPDTVAAWLTKWEQMSPARQVLIDDMRWMIANQNVRDVEQYLRTKGEIGWSK